MEEEFLNILKDNMDLSDFLVNIYLVYKGGRKATLLEYTNIKKDAYINMNFLLNYSVHLGLVILTENENYKRYLVSTPQYLPEYLLDKSKDHDIVLGKILGFICTGHDYGNKYIDRQIVSIYIAFEDKEIGNIVQVCEKGRISKKELSVYAIQESEKLSLLLPDSFKITWKIENDISVYTRLENIKEQQYVRKNIDAYINDLYNEWVPDSKLEKRFKKEIKSKHYNSRIELYQYIWKNFIVHNEFIEKLPGKKALIFMKQFDNEFDKKLRERQKEIDEILRKKSKKSQLLGVKEEINILKKLWKLKTRSFRKK
jgi:hypothetical protein